MRAFAIFRMVTALVTLALVAFVLWIAEGSEFARPLAVGVLLFGLLQWWVLGRMAHQARAEDAAALEESDRSD